MISLAICTMTGFWAAVVSFVTFTTVEACSGMFAVPCYVPKRLAVVTTYNFVGSLGFAGYPFVYDAQTFRDR
jgi:hypothetical protein